MRNSLLTLLFIFSIVQLSYSQNQKWEYNWSQGETLDAIQLQEQSNFNQHNFLIYQFSELPDAIQKLKLESKGIELLGYLGEGHYWVRTSTNAITKRNIEKFNIKSIAHPNASLKQNAYIDAVREHSATKSYVIRLWSADDIPTYSKYLNQNLGFTIVDTKTERMLVVVQAKGNQLAALVNHPAVSYVGPLARDIELLADDGISMHRVNAVHADGPFGPGLKGDGITVGIWDGGVTGNHVDLNNAVSNIESDYYTLNETKHATNVAGMIGGRGHKAIRFMGMAPEAHMKTWSSEGDFIAEMRAGVANEGLNIINSSFQINDYNDPKIEMCNTPGLYVLESSELDKMVRDYPTLTHTIANGNDQFVCQGTYPFAGIPIGIQSAKNVINVGWLDWNELHVSNGSNIGPTLDGRWKPDVMAKGKIVTVPQVNNDYDDTQGSSFAAPAVAGASALLYQEYFNQNGSYPDASLIRALTCNTATDLTVNGTFFGPDFIFGFGRINTARAYEALNNNQYETDNVANSGVKTFQITVPSGLDKLNVAAAWSDPEAIPGDLSPLVNNLDLKVTGPDNTEYLPWVIKPALWFNTAVEGVDSVNNIEQVTVQSPAAGIYTITITGTEVPFGPQDFSLTYDFLEQGIKFRHPSGGEKMVPGEDRWLRWDINGTGAATVIDISYNDGVTWTTIGNPSLAQSYMTWYVTDSTSHECRLRATSGAFQTISEPFTIMKRVESISALACDRFLLMNWDKVDAADSYEILKLDENLDKYIPLDTIADTFFMASDIENGVEVWYAVVARDGSNSALRSDGKNFSPRPISCNLGDDVSVSALVSPEGYRFPFNGTIPTFNESLAVEIKNYSNADITGFNVCYQKSGGSMVCEPYAATFLANSIDTFIFSTTELFDDTISYQYKIWPSHALHPTHANDTINSQIKVIPNYPAALPYFNGFETASKQNYLSGYFGLEGMQEWDFKASSSFGRLSVGRLEQFGYDSPTAITLDRINLADYQSNLATLNLNLDGYQDSTIYLNFAYLDHNDQPDAGDIVEARASENEPWVEIYNFADSTSIGIYTEVNAINLTDILVTQNGQTFGETFQIRIGQEGNNAAYFLSYSSGRSIDNVKVYNVGEDIAITALNIREVYCDSDNGSFPVEISITNLSSSDATNVVVEFTSDNGANVSESIPSILAGESLTYEFTTPLSYSSGEEINVTANIAHSNDQFAENDTLKQIVFIRPFADVSFYDDFEGANQLLEIGKNSSWDLGAPQNTLLQTAASGDNAWVTGLMTYYSHREQSYLYGPCFDFSALTTNPNVAFNLQLNIEEDFDNFGFEYSSDGKTWNPIAGGAQGFNWYNGGGDFWDVDIPNWMPTSNTLDLTGLATSDEVLFRAVMSSDNFTRFEGVSFDDLHITEDIGANLPLSANETEIDTLDVSNQWANATTSNGVWMSIQGDNVNDVIIGVTKETNTLQYTDKFLLERHFWIKGEGQFRCKLYLPYSEYQTFPTKFSEWLAPKDMSILSYSGIFPDELINNNSTSDYASIDSADLQIKPYRDGYILEFDIAGNSEMYIKSNYLDPDNDVVLVDFTATGITASTAQLDWTTSSENDVAGFVLEVSEDGITFDSLSYTAGTGTSSTGVSYTAYDLVTPKKCYMYYRLVAVDGSGNYTYLSVDTASFIYPQIVLINSFLASIVGNDVAVTWNTSKEKCNDRFEIEYSIDGINYNPLGTVASQGDAINSTSYNFLDDITLKVGTIYYQMTQYFVDGSSQFGGVDTVLFVDTLVIELDTITATADNPSTASVTWNTSYELNVDGFIIENGIDGVNFDSIGYVPATALDSMGASYEYLESKANMNCVEYYRVWAINDKGEQHNLGMDTATFIFATDVSVADFSADILNDDVTLTWSSSGERCVDRYEIEYSTDDISYTFLGSVNANDTPSSYNFLDNITVKEDTLYYKLFWYSIEEDAYYLAMDTVIFTDVFVRNNILDNIELFYYNGTINVSLSESFKGTVKVLDSKGAAVHSQSVEFPIGASNIYLNAWKSWPKAIYFVQFINDQGQATLKIPILEQE